METPRAFTEPGRKVLDKTIGLVPRLGEHATDLFLAKNPLRGMQAEVTDTAATLMRAPFEFMRLLGLGLAKDTLAAGQVVLLNLPIPILKQWRQERAEWKNNTTGKLDELRQSIMGTRPVTAPPVPAPALAQTAPVPAAAVAPKTQLAA
jgi:hypothetical protein